MHIIPAIKKRTHHLEIIILATVKIMMFICRVAGVIVFTSLISPCSICVLYSLPPVADDVTPVDGITPLVADDTSPADGITPLVADGKTPPAADTVSLY